MILNFRMYRIILIYRIVLIYQIILNFRTFQKIIKCVISEQLIYLSSDESYYRNDEFNKDESNDKKSNDEYLFFRK